MDWPGLMRAGMRHLRLTPDQFWALTPAELALMLGTAPGGRPMTRARLAALARDWPDEHAMAGDDDDDGQGDAGHGAAG
nr:rcc01693 family protein [Paracoccus isoporae]